MMVLVKQIGGQTYMPKFVEDEKYLNTTEAIQVLGGSKQSFYSNAKPHLASRPFGTRKNPWYKESDILALKEGKGVRKADISIEGMFADWTKYLKSLGYSAETTDDIRDTTTLPQDVVIRFKLPSDRVFFKRERKSYANGTPICIWTTYYPADLLKDVLDQLILGESIDVIEYIKRNHGFIVKEIEERYTARLTTFEELNSFQLKTEQAVLTLQRVGYTKGEQNLVLYSDMALLGNWFDIKKKYEVSHWD